MHRLPTIWLVFIKKMTEYICLLIKKIAFTRNLLFCFLAFLLPKDRRMEYTKICQSNDIKLFCKDYVEKVGFMFIIATLACILVILSLVS